MNIGGYIGFNSIWRTVVGESDRRPTPAEIMTWEEAIRKSSALPASTVGLVDRGFIAVGMAADLVVFNPDTVIDHSTYEQPALPSEGIRHVPVNGKEALRDGVATGEKGGRALVRSSHMPTRPMTKGARRRVKVAAALQNVMAGPTRPSEAVTISIDISQSADARSASGTFAVVEEKTKKAMRSTALGELQTMDKWAGSGTMPLSAVTIK